MCGLTGILADCIPAANIVTRMTDSLTSRGPDDGDVWMDEMAGIALGHRRLAVLDLSPAGHQPMHSTCGRFVITFNGEIYNHLELRHTLTIEAGGIAWRGHSDTETLLACFAVWGVRETLKRSVGMFAFALWDRTDRRLYLARDRFGEKPLYYGWSGRAFIFGSELKALRWFPGFDNSVDRDVVALYLQFRYVPAPYAIYRHTYKLEPGCILSLPLSAAISPPNSALFAPASYGDLIIERYWSLAESVQRGLAQPIVDEGDAVDQLEAVLLAAVRQQSNADVPLGAFLSGGIDSSTIVALMQAQSPRPVHTFTIGFEEAGFNEAHYANAVAQYLGTNHTELYVSSQQARDVIPRLPELYCEPFADPSQIPTHLVSQLARRQVIVALSGDGGDELFGGYNRYFLGPRIWNLLKWVPRSARKTLGSNIRRVPSPMWDTLGTKIPGISDIAQLGDKAHKLAHRLQTVNRLDDLYLSLVSEWTAETGVVPGAKRIPTLLDDTAMVRGVPQAELRMMVWDTLSYLPDDVLHKVDRASMGVSLETRAPFLDHRVAELAWRLPLHLKVRGGQGKWALRQVLLRHVPIELIDRPKAGFGVPVNQWLRGPLREWAEDLLSEKRLNSSGLLSAAPIRKKWKEHLNGTHDWTASLWAVLMFGAWLAQEDN